MDTHWVFLLICVTQQFAYGINSQTFLSSTYSTRRGELLITFRNGNLTQISSVGQFSTTIVEVPFCVLRYATVCFRN